MKSDKLKSIDKIVEASTALFSMKGFKATTIRDIASEAGVNSSLISYHFNGKEGLLHKIVTDFLNSNVKDLVDILNDDIESFEFFKLRLEFFLDSTIKLGTQNWRVLKIILSETYELSKFEDFNMTSLSSLQSVAAFVQQAQDKKFLKSDFCSLMLADNILALTMDQIVNWPMNQKLRNFDISEKEARKEWIKENLRLYFQGVSVTNVT